MRVNPANIFASTALCLLLASCAQTGPPLPPSLELPKPPSDLRAIRKGDRVTLSWNQPTLTTDRQSVRYLGPTLICRSAENEITACGAPAATVPAPTFVPQRPSVRHAAKQKSASSRPTPQLYTDTLPPSLLREDASAGVTYAVEVLNRNGRGAGLSNRVHVPAIATLPPPSDFAATLTGDGVAFTWTSPGEPPKVAAKSLQLRYRIYRRDESSGKDAVAGEIPLDGAGPVHFTDSGFEWEKTYLYRATVVSIITRPDSEVQVEGEDTSPVRVVAHDIFPPGIPAGLQAVYSGEGQKPFIDLIWAPVTNADLAGYNIYRSNEGENKPASNLANKKMTKLNSQLVISPSYRDVDVISGKTYKYSVSAVDVRGNESQQSEATGESVP